MNCLTEQELHQLVQRRANEAYADLQAAKKLKPSKRAAAIRKAEQMQAACEVASGILGERPDPILGDEREERIKSLFLYVISQS